jgi:class 3 adenylate cyclase
VDNTFWFVDLAGFTALTEAHGDETSADLVERFAALVEHALCADGTLVSVIGDAVFLVSPQPHAALAALDRLVRAAGHERDFPMLRAGLHHGEATQRGKQFYGAAVNLAARVAAHASSGQILATAPVADAARAEGIEVTPVGPTKLKNVHDLVELFDLAISPAGAGHAVDPVCRMRIPTKHAAAHLALPDGREHWFCSEQCLQLFVERGR